MKPQDYFQSQANFNQWLQELTETEEAHIVQMLDEYADSELEQYAKNAKLQMLKKMLENDSISKENYNYYYQIFCK